MSGSKCATQASKSRRWNASAASRTSSTFSRDIRLLPQSHGFEGFLERAMCRDHQRPSIAESHRMALHEIRDHAAVFPARAEGDDERGAIFTFDDASHVAA